MASLTAGYTAIIDATILRKKDCKRVAASAELGGVPFVGLRLEAPSEVFAARTANSADDRLPHPSSAAGDEIAPTFNVSNGGSDDGKGGDQK